MNNSINSLVKHPDIFLGNATARPQQDSERIPLGIEKLDIALAGGIPTNGLTRLRCHLGSGEFQLLKPIWEAKRHKKRVWIYQHHCLNPLWFAKNPWLQNAWLLTPTNEQQALWACEQCIRSQCCDLIIYCYQSLNIKYARRLQVLSKQNDCLLLNIDYSSTLSVALPVNLDFELLYKHSTWMINVHRVLGCWPKHGVIVPNPVPASNAQMATILRKEGESTVSRPSVG